MDTSDNKKFKIGITGNIGSGKSTICHVFEVLNVPVYYSDLRAKKLINSDPEIMSVYKRIFGSGIYIDGLLDRKQVAETLFNNKKLLKEVEIAVHPAVMQDFDRWNEEQQSRFVLYESAILFEKGNNRFMDKTIFVSAPEQLRIKRVMKRDNVSKEAVYARIRNQWKEEEKIKISDFVIVCDDITPVIPQVLELYDNIILSAV